MLYVVMAVGIDGAFVTLHVATVWQHEFIVYMINVATACVSCLRVDNSTLTVHVRCSVFWLCRHHPCLLDIAKQQEPGPRQQPRRHSRRVRMKFIAGGPKCTPNAFLTRQLVIYVFSLRLRVHKRKSLLCRHHRYIFDEAEKREAGQKSKTSKVVARLQELGPRFTLKLLSLQKGVFDSKSGEFEWVHKHKTMDTSRRRFHL